MNRRQFMAMAAMVPAAVLMAEPAPKGVTENMVVIRPGKFVERLTDRDGNAVIDLFCDYKGRQGQFLVAEHPDAQLLKPGDWAPCIVAEGRTRKDLRGRRLYYYLAKDEVTSDDIVDFLRRHPGVKLP